MNHVLELGSTDPEVVWVKQQLAAQGYPITLTNSVFDAATVAQVKVFQCQHIGEDGHQLVIDGKIEINGAATWWALGHPSGHWQKNGLPEVAPRGLTPMRQLLIASLLAEHAKGICEVPDGSNDSPRIREYLAPRGLKRLPWCCAFVSFFLRQCSRLIGGIYRVGVQDELHAAQDIHITTAEPKPGDIFVMLHDDGKGHTGFVIGVSMDGQRIFTCEGNAGNRVKLGKRAIGTLPYFIDALQDGQDMNFERRDLTASDLAGSVDR